MEPKKIKKLVIKKETISALTDYSQSKLKGGAESGYSGCLNYTKDGCPKLSWEDSCWNLSKCAGQICFTAGANPCATDAPTPSGQYSCCANC